MTCVNCQTEITGKFCSNCGQRAGVKRMSLKESWLDFWSRVYGFDGMLPRTLTDLTIRPGVAAKRFIEGNRVKYYGPVGYFFLMVTVCLLVFSMMDVDFFEFMKGMQKELPESSAPKLQEKIQRFVSDNIKIFAFLIIPFQALAARYILFRKSGYNFLENMVLPLYITGHLFWITILNGIIYKWTGRVSLTGNMIVGVLFLAFGYATLMTYQPKQKAFLKGIVLAFTAYLIFITVFSLIAVIGVPLAKWLSPETFEMIRPSNNR
jgi:hypothetical protein